MLVCDRSVLVNVITHTFVGLKCLTETNARTLILRKKKEMSELGYKGGTQNGHPFRNVQRGTIYVNESGLFALILRSQLESARAFKRWVTKDVLPSIRKTGRYDYGMNRKYNDSLTFKIENEMDLHVKVVSFLRRGIHTVY